MSGQLYNVKRVAQIISRSDDERVIEQTIRKIRHWTNEDVLSPVGDKHTGTGVSRMYDEEAIYIAALLLEITKYGVTVDHLDTFEEWIKECWEETDEWEASKRGAADLVFQLGWNDQGGGFSCVVREDKGLFWSPFGSDESESYTSSIVVNATNVFKRLAW